MGGSELVAPHIPKDVKYTTCKRKVMDLSTLKINILVNRGQYK